MIEWGFVLIGFCAGVLLAALVLAGVAAVESFHDRRAGLR